MRLKLKKIEVHELPYTEIVKSATITVDSPQDTMLACLSGAQMGSIHEKNRDRKSCDTAPFVRVISSRKNDDQIPNPYKKEPKE